MIIVNNKPIYFRLIWATVILLAASAAQAQFRNLSSVHDGSGMMSTNTVTLGSTPYYHVSAAGQPGGIFTNAGGAWINYAGFLQAVDIKRPNLDTDGDGIINEISADNDGDRLTDLAEVEGSQFSPTSLTDVNNRDTDGDNVPDGDESIAGTNPTNEDSFLQIVSIQRSGQDKIVQWTARGGKNYRVLADNVSYDVPTNQLASTTASGGSAPWYETVASYTNVMATSNRYYAIEAQK